MRHIYITQKLKDAAKAYAANLFQRASSTKAYEELEALRDEMRQILQPNYERYVQTILDTYDTSRLYSCLNDLLPSEFENWKNRFDNIVPEADLSKKIPSSDPNSFYKRIVIAMRYGSAAQKNSYFEHFRTLKINTCVYCNAMLAIAPPDRSPTFQLDHYKPQATHPFLSTSFFNFHPSCGPCNLKKTKNPIELPLYVEQPSLARSPFLFSIDQKDILQYRLTRNKSVLRIHFNPATSSPHDVMAHNDHTRTFNIAPVYNSLRGIAAELIDKQQIYTKAYTENLHKSFGKLFRSSDYVERLILGNYAAERDIHHRPFAKFMQDIARSIKLLK